MMLGIAKQALRKTLRNLGYTVVKTGTETYGHELVYPRATYAPWSVHKEFLSAYEAIASHTLVDKYRCWELWNLVGQTRSLPGDFIEVGVWRGGTGCLIAKRVESLGMSGDVILCDTFSGVAKAGVKDDVYRGGEHADTSEAVVRALAARLGVRAQLLKGVFPEETGTHVQDKKFRFCHIDVDVYESARGSTEWLWPVLVSGGILVFDDYGFEGCDGVRRLVEEWSTSTPCTFLHNLNGHAILLKP